MNFASQRMAGPSQASRPAQRLAIYAFRYHDAVKMPLRVDNHARDDDLNVRKR